MPLSEALGVNFLPKDALEFFKQVTQQTMEARRESGQVRSVPTVAVLSIFFGEKIRFLIVLIPVNY